MQDKSSFSNPNKPEISQGLQDFINEMVEGILLKGDSFEKKKKWLKKYSENEGLNFDTLVKGFDDFFESIPEYNNTSSLSIKRLIKIQAEQCYITDETFETIINANQDIQISNELSTTPPSVTSNATSSLSCELVGGHLLDVSTIEIKQFLSNPLETHFETNKSYFNTFIDKRDNQLYHSAKIGNQEWLAENLKFKSDYGCVANDFNDKNSSLYGYLYNYKAAKDSVPEGWRLPSISDIEILIKHCNGIKEPDSNCLRYSNLGILKLDSEVWSRSILKSEENKIASSISLFSAIPGGDFTSFFSGIGKFANWWIQEKGIFQFPNYRFTMNYISNDLSIYNGLKSTNYYSVRCIKI